MQCEEMDLKAKEARMTGRAGGLRQSSLLPWLVSRADRAEVSTLTLASEVRQTPGQRLMFQLYLRLE